MLKLDITVSFKWWFRWFLWLWVPIGKIGLIPIGKIAKSAMSIKTGRIQNQN